MTGPTGAPVPRPDYHIHLERYGISRDALLRLVDAAHAAGVSEIAITEHAYHFVQCRAIYPPDNAWIHDPNRRHQNDWDLDAYVHLLTRARDEGLPVKMGMEWDYCPGRERELERLIRGYDWDITLGAVHWLPGRGGGYWGFDLTDQAVEWRHRDVRDVYQQYFTLLVDAAALQCFDVMAHPDVVKVFGHRAEGDLGPWYDRVAAALATAGVCAEVSTAGWRKPAAELYPAPALLAALRRHDVPVVINSDAHSAEEIGSEMHRAEGMVRAAGYTTRCVFTHRRREDVPL